jgi:hypothetical protein
MSNQNAAYLHDLSTRVDEKVWERWERLVSMVFQQRGLPNPYEERRRARRIQNSNFNVPRNVNRLETVAIANNAENAIMGEPINMGRPILNINNEKEYGRYYQNNASIRGLRNTKKNPFTRKNITKVTWYKPVSKPKNNNNKKNNNKK